MRAIALVDRLEFEFSGSVCQNAITVGDVDNDGDNELIIGNDNGELVVYKGSEKYQSITGLGLVTCAAVGDIFNIGKNSLVIIAADGWCFIYSICYEELQDSDQAVGRSKEGEDDEPKRDPLPFETLNNPLKCVHVQRIPANTKVVLLGDIDGDGSIEMVLGLTDRVVRSYRWFNNPDIVTQSSGFLESSNSESAGRGKLVGLNKWECANQIGSVTLHHSADGAPALLVAQPGGTFMRIRCQPDDHRPLTDQSENNSVRSDCLAASGVDYQFLGLSRMRNPNISTEIVGDLVSGGPISTSKAASFDGSNEGPAMFAENPSEASSEAGKPGGKEYGSPYAVATLDGTIMLVQNETILWAIQFDHQIFALTKMDVNGNGSDEIVACSWDGHTYILDQNKNSVRLQLGEPVQAFAAGFYSTLPGTEPARPCFIYVTFNNKVYLCHSADLKNMIAKTFTPDFTVLKESPLMARFQLEVPLDKLPKNERKKLVKYLLYELKDADGAT